MRIRNVVIGAMVGALVVALSSVSNAGEARCFGERATIVTGSGDNTIHGTRGDDVIFAGGGNDRIFARGGNDLICAGGGNDRVRGGPGNDKIAGGFGNDVPFTSNRRPDVRGGLLGNEGDDLVRGGAGIDLLRGGKGNDVLKGGPDADNGLFAVGIDASGDEASRNGPSPSGGQFRASWDGKVDGGVGDDRLFGNGDHDYLDSRDDIENNDRLDGGRGDDDFCRSDPDPEVRCEVS
jgi:hypothetical protein